jgi:aspartate/methionine/tyrosine aminotransferase
LLGREGVAQDEPPGLPGPGWDPQLSLADLCRRDQRAEVHADFLRTISTRYGVAPECVVPTLGASQAIPQVLFALARPGDHVIVERPTYEPLHRVPEMLGLSVSRLERKFEEGWSPLPDRLARLLTPKTRAVILSNLHNPSGVGTRTETLVAIGEMAARVGAVVLVDEVYLDFAFASSGETRPWRPAAVAIENGVSWSSATKCLGFAALRAGWVVTRDVELAQALRSSSLYFHVDPPLASLALATRVLRHAAELAARAERAIAPARTTIDRWIAGEPRVTWIAPSAGQTALIRLPDLMQDLAFTQHLRERYDTQVVPGAMFEAPGFVRLSFNLPVDQLEQALANFSAALDDL